MTLQQTIQNQEKFQIVSKQDVEELQTSHKTKQELSNKVKIPISMHGMVNSNYEVSGHTIDIAHTLLARDWKGPSTYAFNGVVEYYE